MGSNIEYIGTAEAARLLQMTGRRVVGLCSEGKLSGAFRSGRNWKIPVDSIKQYMKDTGIGVSEESKEDVRNLLPVAIGNTSYIEVSSECYYVDKTLLIRDLIDGHNMVTLFTRPRRFGKTLAINTIKTFFEKTEDDTSRYFTDRDIWLCGEKYRAMQGIYPVVMLTFKDVKYNTWEESMEAIRLVVKDEYKRHPELLTSTVLDADDKNYIDRMEKGTLSGVELQRSLLNLTHMLSVHHGSKVVILVDEYDTPIQAAYLNHYYEEAIEFLRDMFAESFKDNDQMARAVITGITRIAKESLFSEMNNLAVYSVMSGGYDAVFGFTEDEMHTVLEEFDLIEQEGLIRNWYDGFSIGNMTKIYNPWSVISYLSKREYPPEDYWAQSGGLALVDYLLKKSGIAVKKGFETLLGGGTIWRRIREDLIFPRLDTDENAVWSLLVAAGYLKPVKEFGNSPVTGLSVTNHESMICLSELVKGWFEGSSGNYMEKFADALLRGDLYEMNEEFSQAVLICASTFDSARKPSEGNAQPENFFSIEPRDRKEDSRAFILEFKVFSEKEGDVILADTAKRARKQIDEKKYDTDLLSRGFPPDAVAKYGFGFRGKEVLITA